MDRFANVQMAVYILHARHLRKVVEKCAFCIFHALNYRIDGIILKKRKFDKYWIM